MIIKAIDVSCDVCHTDYDSPEWSVALVRAKSSRDGWHTTAVGRDICPDCWDKGLR